MNTLIAMLLVASVVAMAAAQHGGYNDGYNGRYGNGFRRTGNGIEAAYNNAYRQQQVNHIAEHVGASSGTARYYGVPGTGRYFGRGYYGDYDRRGYGGY